MMSSPVSASKSALPPVASKHVVADDAAIDGALDRQALHEVAVVAEHQAVVRARFQPVVAFAADQEVGAVAAVDEVVALAGEDFVVIDAAPDPVVAGVGDDQLDAAAGADDVVAARWSGSRRRRTGR